MVLGIAWGMAAAFGRGWVDEILMRLADTVMAIPQILFALVFISAFGADPVKLAVIIGVLLTPTTARLVRSSVLSELQEDYFTAAVAFGSTRRRLLFAEVLPNAKGPIVVQAAINAANAILLEASMSFVGLGIAPPEATWGTLVQQGYQKMYQSIGYVLFPALFIFVTIWLLNVLADQFGGDRKEGPMTDLTPVLQVQDLTVSYGDVMPVQGITFAVRPGERIGLVGESGSGKSLTALSIMRLNDGATLGGSIRLRDRELLTLSPREMTRVRGGEIAMVYQDPMSSLNPVRTIGHQLVEAIRLHDRVSAAAARARAVELLTEVGCRCPRSVWASTRTSSPAGCGSAS